MGWKTENRGRFKVYKKQVKEWSWWVAASLVTVHVATGIVNAQTLPIRDPGVAARGYSEFAAVPEGCFQMGSNASGFDQEHPVHKVCLKSFEIGKYEVRQGEWQEIMGNNPSYFPCGENCPVEQVSWDDAQRFIHALNARGDGYVYRLPTEAEWEYACRGGVADQKYCGGGDLETVAWTSLNSGDTTHPVGRKAANGFGLYDMSGNVWEWVQDWYKEEYYSELPTDNPIGPSSGVHRVNRGGSWHRAETCARASNRYDDPPDFRTNYVGFRLARNFQRTGISSARP